MDEAFAFRYLSTVKLPYSCPFSLNINTRETNSSYNGVNEIFMRYSKTSFGNIRMKCVVVDRRYIDALKVVIISQLQSHSYPYHGCDFTHQSNVLCIRILRTCINILQLLSTKTETIFILTSIQIRGLCWEKS